MPTYDLAAELKEYPLTGRFLAGRLRHDMGEREKRILENAIEKTEVFDKPKRLLERGKVYDRSTLLIDGFLLRTLEGPSQRYAVSFHVPGDFVDLHCFALKRLDHNLDSLGRVEVGYVSHDKLQNIIRDEPHLARLFWFSTLLDAAMHREWVMKLEQLTTPRRIAHIVAEIRHRLIMVGLGDDNGFVSPLTQTDLSEMSGATAIHVNRAIKELREKNIVDIDRGTATIVDVERLHAYANFDPAYLYGDGDLHLREGVG